MTNGTGETRNIENTFSLCELREAVEAIKDAFEQLGDILAGVKCAGVLCDKRLPLDPPDVSSLDEWRGGVGGGGHCSPPGCSITAPEFDTFTEYWTQDKGAIHSAVRVVINELKGLKKQEIKYMSFARPGWPSQLRKARGEE